LTIKFSPAQQAFLQEVRQPEAEIDVAKAALYIAQEEFTNLDIGKYLRQIDELAAAVARNFHEKSYPLKTIENINNYLYGELGYRGNQEDYYDPRNSFLNEVIDRRTGIPITLAVVYLEIARRLDFPMVGIGMPGHFLIRPDFEDVGIFVDVFHQGEILFEQDCLELLRKMYQQPLPSLPPEFLVPVTSKQLLARMLTNLKFIYLQQNDLAKALAAVERILLIFPEDLGELRDRGIIHTQLGNFFAATFDLETYLEQVPYGTDTAKIRQLLAQIRQQAEE
jgi:regulator of sirC expression with transglutaminase-like and TPR domain